MDDKKNQRTNEQFAEARIKLIKIASVGVAGAIVLACYVYTRIDDVVLSTLLYGTASLIATFSLLFIFGALSLGRAEKHKKNFFLYDRKTKADIPVSELTLAEVRKRLIEFMSIFKRHGRLHVGDLFEENPHIPDHFKPLFCFEILYELATGECGVDHGTFLSFGSECAEIFEKYLRQAGDHTLATSLKGFILDYSTGGDTAQRFSDFLTENKEHIERKMLEYTKENINKFD